MKKEYFSPEIDITSLRLEAIMDKIRPSFRDPIEHEDDENDDLG